MRFFAFFTGILCLCFAGCSGKKTDSGPGPHAVVILRDGSQYSGNVIRSSPNEIAIAGDDKVEHAFPMSNVQMVDYGTAASAAAPPMPATGPAPVAPPPVAPPPVDQAPAPVPAAPAPAPMAPTPEEVAHEQEHYHPTGSEVPAQTFDLPTGTQLVVRTEEAIDSRTAEAGQTYAAEVSRNVRDTAGNIVIPHGSNAQIVIRAANPGGKVRGTSDLVLDLNSVSVNGRRYHVSTLDIREKGKAGIGANKRTGKFVGGGALFGTVIGAIAGHGKGAVIGGLSGAAAGGVAEVATKGGAIHLPAETLLTFQLDRPLHVATTR